MQQRLPEIPASPGAPPGGGAPPERLEGVLDRVVYANEETAWTVARLIVPGDLVPVTIVGNLLGVQPGESLQLSGSWTQDRRWGRQFRVEAYLPLLPATLEGIRRYLASGLVAGIGPVMAGRLVDHFGLQTLDVIEEQGDRLREVPGIGPQRAQKILAAWSEQRAVKEVMVFLHAHGVSSTFAVKIFKRYGARALAVVRQNPYQLALDISGIGFRTADAIAARLGIDRQSPHRAQAGLLHLLGELADAGHVFGPRELLFEQGRALLELDTPLLQAALDALAEQGRVVLEPLRPAALGAGGEAEPAVYLQPLHAAEALAAARLLALAATPVAPLRIDVDGAIAWLRRVNGLELAERQQQALRLATRAKVLVLTGGPGTGKTTLVHGILQVLGAKGRRILLAAPTGRAAKRLTESTGQSARTIHRLLEFSPKNQAFARNADHPLEADLVVVDECSMVDIVLFSQLLAALPPACQLLLVGDVDQLPSVGPGNVLRDVIRSGVAEVVTLDQIFRQAQSSRIVVNAHRIHAGELPLGDEGGEPGAQSDFFFIEREAPEELLATVKELIARRIPRRFHFDPVDDVQLLTPMHRGLLGAANLNAELQRLLNPDGAELVRGSRLFRVGDKVMQHRNNYELEVFNGDIGRVTAIDAEARCVTVRFDERLVVYEAADLDELSLAYACSIHKSQGSEYPAVVLLLHTQHYLLLQRNLLYTGITRGKKLVVIVGSRRALSLAVHNHTIAERYTRLAERLAHPTQRG